MTSGLYIPIYEYQEPDLNGMAIKFLSQHIILDSSLHVSELQLKFRATSNIHSKTENVLSIAIKNSIILTDGN